MDFRRRLLPVPNMALIRPGNFLFSQLIRAVIHGDKPRGPSTSGLGSPPCVVVRRITRCTQNPGN